MSARYIAYKMWCFHDKTAETNLYTLRGTVCQNGRFANTSVILDSNVLAYSYTSTVMKLVIKYSSNVTLISMEFSLFAFNENLRKKMYVLHAFKTDGKL